MIKPLFNRRLIKYVKQTTTAQGLTLGSQRQLDAIAKAIDLHTEERLLCVPDGWPIDENRFILEPGSVVGINGRLQHPWACIAPVNWFGDGLIITPERYTWTGWYEILACWDESFVGKECYPFYGCAIFPMADGSDYISTEGIALVKDD